MTQLDSDRTGRTLPLLVVPAYFHPALHPEQWAMLVAHPERVRLVVLNRANGPGISPDPTHLAPLASLREAGIAVAGYVDTDYGRRATRDVLADLFSYLEWYEVDGVCFDRVSVNEDHLRHYAELARSARAIGAGSVMFNHGAHPLEPYAEHADLLGTFEGPWSAYRELGVPRWTRKHPPENFYHVVHSAPRARFEDAYLLAQVRRAGCAYVTDRGGANPYDSLPADWLEGEL
ncbi:MAG: spherulation-specific family 4 protein [Acidimicrobiales bacterium]